VTLRVSDDGIGIRPEIADRIFDPFFTTKEAVRAPVGLSIVYTVVRVTTAPFSSRAVRGTAVRFVSSFLRVPTCAQHMSTTRTGARRRS